MKRIVKHDDDDAPLTLAELRRMRPAREVAPKIVRAYETGKLRLRGRPKSSQKSAISLRLDNDTIAALRASGEGWQTRVNDLLRAAVGITA